MIKKRKRPDSKEPSSIKSLNHSTSYMTKNYYSKIFCINENKKLYSIFAPENCYYCKIDVTKENTGIFNCNQCFKYFHKNCLINITSDTALVNSNICPLCEELEKNQCYNCKQEINNTKDIQVTCELCGIISHLDCLGQISLPMFFKRKFYYQLLEIEPYESEFSKFETDLKNFEENEYKTASNKLEAFKNFFTTLYPNLNVNTFLNLFLICKYCLYNIDKPDNNIFYSDFKIVKNTAYYKFTVDNLPSIHEVYAIATLVKHKDININQPNISDYQVKQILDFFYLNNDTGDGYYLIKWKKNNLKYSFEFSKFIQNNKRFQELYPVFINNKQREENFYSECYKKGYDFYSCRDYISWKDFLDEFRCGNYNNLNELNEKVIQELESYHVYLLHDKSFIDHIRNELIAPMISNIISNSRKTNSFISPKILICYDDNSILKKWKNIIKNLDINFLTYKQKKFHQILYEMFYLDIKNLIKPIRLNNDDIYKQSFLQEEFFNSLESYILNYNLVKFDIILINKDSLLEDYNNLFSKISFDLILLDFIDKESIVGVKNIVYKNLLNKNLKMIILKSLDTEDINTNDDFHLNFSNFLFTFYPTDHYLIEHIPDWKPNVKILSKDKKYFPPTLEEMLIHLKREYQFSVLNMSYKSNPYTLSRTNFYYKIREANLMDLKINNSKVFINFIPIGLSKVDYLQYLSILRERKSILNKKQENKNDLIKNLATFCYFPSLMVKYYLNKLEDSDNKLLKIEEDCLVNRNKLNSLCEMIKLIFSINNKCHINILYSEPNLDTDSRLIQTIKLLKTSVFKNFDKEKKKNIHFYSLLSDEIDTIFSNINEQNVFVFFNVCINSRIVGKFFRYAFNSFKNRNLFIYQFYLENTIEQNLAEQFYLTIDDMVGSDAVLFSNLSKENKEILLKKNLMKLRYVLNENIFNEKILPNFIFEKENSKISLDNMDGMMIIDNSSVIYAKNSDFIRRSDYVDYSWNYILEEYYKECNDFGNSIEEDGYRTRNNKRIIKVNEDKEIMNSILNSSNIIPLNKKQRLIIEDEELDNNFENNLEKTLKKYNDQLNNNQIGFNNIQNFFGEDNTNDLNKTKDLLSKDLTPKKNNDSNNPNCNNLNSEKSKVLSLEVIIIDDYDDSNLPPINNLPKQQKNQKETTDKDIIENIINNNNKYKEAVLNNYSVNSNKDHKDDKSSSILSLSSLNDVGKGKSQKIKKTKNKKHENKMLLNSSFDNLMIDSTYNGLTFNGYNFSKNLENNDQGNINISSYLIYLQNKEKDFIGTDVLQEVNHHLIKIGFNLNVRKFILSDILKNGIDLFNLEGYTENLFAKINLTVSKKIEKDALRFYIEYLIVILKDFLLNTSSTNDQIINGINIPFYFESVNPNEIKKRIMIISKVKNYIASDQALLLNELKTQIKNIIKHLQNSKILKPKFNPTNLNQVTLNTLCYNILRCITVYGYGEYDTFLNSRFLRQNLIDEKADNKAFKSFLYSIATGIKKEDQIDQYLCNFIKEIYLAIESNLLDRF